MDDSRMDAKMLKTSKTLLWPPRFGALTTAAFAQAAAPTPWVLKPDMGYGYGKDGKTFSYKMGTNNAGMLLKGAKKVPKGTCSSSARTASSTCGPGRSSRATASSCSDPDSVEERYRRHQVIRSAAMMRLGHDRADR